MKELHQTERMRVSNKIFIEIKKPKGKIIIDDNHKECTLQEAIKELCAEKKEACDAPQDEAPCREAETLSQEDRQETHSEEQSSVTDVPTQEPEQEELPSSHELHQSDPPLQDQCA